MYLRQCCGWWKCTITPVRKVFAERKVPQQCLGGNKSTSTGFLPHCQSSREIYSMRNMCKLSSYYLIWRLCTLITLAYSPWVDLESVTVPIIIWTAHVWQRIVLVLPLPPRHCCGTFLSAKTMRTGVMVTEDRWGWYILTSHTALPQIHVGDQVNSSSV